MINLLIHKNNEEKTKIFKKNFTLVGIQKAMLSKFYAIQTYVWIQWIL